MRRPGPLGHPLLRRLRRAVGRRLVIDRAGPQDVVVLAGTGRSGTTWVGEVINWRGDHRVLFEPFHPERVPVMAPFRGRRYLRPHETSPQYLEPAAAAVTGRLRHPWVDRHNTALVARRRLVKEIRANLLLGWLHRAFPALRLVLLLRHPCAVARSRLRLGWEAPLDALLAQPALLADHLEPYRALLAAPASPFHRHVLLWCVETLVPLRQLGPDTLQVVFYERLLTDPHEEGNRLFAWLGRPAPPRLAEHLARPSSQARRDSAVRSGDDPVRGWVGRVPPEEVRRAVRTVEAFGLAHLYGADPLPLAGAVPVPVSVG